MAKPKTKEEKAAARQQLTVEFFTELSKHLPEESREYVTKLAEVAKENVTASDYVAEHIQRQQDYSRGRGEIDKERVLLEDAKKRSDTMYRDNVAWHADNKAEYDRMQTQLEHYQRVATADLDDTTLGGGGDPGASTGGVNGTAPDMPGYIKEEEVKKLLEERDRGAMEYEALVADLRHRHEESFSEFLNVRELVDHATKKNQRLVDAYDEVYGDRIKEKTDADLEERIVKERTEAATQAREELIRENNALPYHVGDHEPTAVDYLTGRTEVPESGAKAAVDEYYRMQQAKNA